MRDLRSGPRIVYRPVDDQVWLTARRGDLISLAGAAVVVLLVFAILIVIAREGHSDPPVENLPPLPFAGSTVVYLPAGVLP